MAVSFADDIDLDGLALQNALIDPLASDPGSPANGQLWYRTDTGRLRARVDGATEDVALLSDVTAGAITGALWNAQSVVIAVTDDTPTAITFAAGEILGRGVSGDLRALSATEVRAVIGVEPGATADQTPAQLLTAVKTVDGSGSGLDADLLDGLEASAFATDAEVTALFDGSRAAATIGDGTTTTFNVTHSLGSEDVTVEVYEISTGTTFYAKVTRTSTTVVSVAFGSAPSTNQFRVVVKY